MKICKKLICVLLIICILPLSSFAVYAQSNENNSSEAERIFKKLVALDLLDENDIVNTEEMLRSDFVRIAMKTAGITVSESSFEDSPYKDLESTGLNFPYIVMANKLGYLTSDNGRFYPNNAISYNDAIKILVGILGYGFMAERSGGYPGGYIKFAASSKLLSGISIKSGNALSLSDGLALIENSLNAVITEEFYSRKSVEYAISNQTLADYLGIYEVKGIISENSVTGLYSRESDENSICVGNVKMMTESAHEFDEFLGYYCKVFYTQEGGDYTIKYCERVDSRNDELLVMADDIEYQNGKYVYRDEKHSNKTASLSSNYSVIYNGKFAAAGECPMDTDNGYIKLIDNNGDNRYDVVFIMQFTTHIIDGIGLHNNSVTTNNLLTFELETDRDSCSHIFVNGKESDLSVVTPRVIGSYAESLGTGRKVKNLYISSRYVSGVIESVGEDEIEIDGGFYKARNDIFETLKPGLEGKFLIDEFGYICYYSSENTMLYGYLNDMYYGTSGLRGRLEVKIFTQSGAFEIYETAKKVTLNDRKKIPAAEVYDLLIDPETQNFRQFIRYSLDTEGNIKKIETATEIAPYTMEGLDASDKGIFRLSSSGQLRYRSSNSSFDGAFAIDSDSLIFAIPPTPETADDEDFTLLTKSYLANDNQYTYEAYNIDKSGKVEFLLLRTTYSGSLRNITVVDSKCTVITEDGEEYAAIRGYTQGEKTTYLLKSPSLASNISEGDIITCNRNKYMEIISITKLWDADNGVTSKFLSGTQYSTSTFFGGMVVSYDKALGRLILEYGEEEYIMLSLGSLTTATQVYDNEYSQIPVSDIKVGDCLIGNYNKFIAQNLFVVR